LGSEPLQIVKLGTVQLVKNVLVAQRTFHQPKATAKAIRQANRLSKPVVLSVSKRNLAEPEETPVRDALMKRLTDIASDQNKTTGVDRQVRHMGQYAPQGTSARDTQKATLQNLAATVSVGIGKMDLWTKFS
jgi:hypothetical protein